MPRYAANPIGIVEAIQFTGSNWPEMHSLTGHVEVAVMPTDAFAEIGTNLSIELQAEGYTAELYTEPLTGWVAVKVGDWVLHTETRNLVVDDVLFQDGYTKLAE